MTTEMAAVAHGAGTAWTRNKPYTQQIFKKKLKKSNQGVFVTVAVFSPA
jgi:hypothetical protein